MPDGAEHAPAPLQGELDRLRSENNTLRQHLEKLGTVADVMYDAGCKDTLARIGGGAQTVLHTVSPPIVSPFAPRHRKPRHLSIVRTIAAIVAGVTAAAAAAMIAGTPVHAPVGYRHAVSTRTHHRQRSYRGDRATSSVRNPGPRLDAGSTVTR